MTIRVTKEQRVGTVLPRFPVFDCDALLREPCFPRGEVLPRDGKCDVDRSVCVSTRRRTFSKEKQYVAIARAQCAQACVVIELIGSVMIDHVKADYTLI